MGVRGACNWEGVWTQPGIRDGDGDGDDKQVDVSVGAKAMNDGGQPDIWVRDYEEEASIGDRNNEDADRVAGSK